MKAKFIALATLVLGLASCQQDFDAPVQMNGEVDFQLSVAATELAGTRAGENGADTQNAYDSAYGAIDYLQGGNGVDPLRVDWAEVDLRYSLEVYDKADNYTDAVPVKDRMVQIVDSYEPVKFDLRLVPNRDYHFVVFADFVPNGASEDANVVYQSTLGLRHTIGDNLGDITINDDAINDEIADAYFDTEDITITNSASQDMILKRPYGKVRVIATDLAELNLNVNPDAVKVAYTAKHPQKFNAVTGTIDEYANEAYEFVYDYEVITSEVAKGGLQNHLYTADYDAKTATNANGVERHTHMTLFTDYILAEQEQAPIHFTMTVYDNYAADSKIKETIFSTDIPVKRNMLTTIIGNVLTTATDITVTIDDNFAGENVVESTPVNDTESFKAALLKAAQHEYATIELTKDIKWNVAEPLLPADAKTKELAIVGNGRTFTAEGVGHYSLHADANTLLIFSDLTFADETIYTAENGEKAWEFCYLEIAGKVRFENCVIDYTIMTEGPQAEFVKCQFNDKSTNPANAANEYAAWVYSGDALFQDCDITGYRGIKICDYYDDSEVNNVVIDNCRFTNISKKPGIAIDDHNSVGEPMNIVIKNSTFTNCKAGDQGNYIYESDNAVPTLENNTVVVAAPTAEDFANALKLNTENIEVVLAADIDCPISSLGQQTGGSGEYKLGGENTNYITIDLNGKKLNITTSYWSGIGAKNDNALFTIKNGTMTSSQATGTWNSYDVTFANCNYAIENVTFEKSIAFTNAEKAVALKNVTINETHDYYAMWISAKGQNVDINGLTVNAENGRGIKVDEQYLDASEVKKVTLNINDMKVHSQKKAAIVVKSQAGAEVNLENIDITGVYADPFHAVWVDEDAAAYADLVTVNGGKKMVEGDTNVAVVRGNDAMSSAIANGAETVYLNEGTYTVPAEAKGKTISIIGGENAVVDATYSYGQSLSGANITFEGVTIKGQTSGNYNGFTHTGDLTFNKCTFEGKLTVYSNSTFNNCVFNNKKDYAVWTSWGGDKTKFVGCTFNSGGKALLLYGGSDGSKEKTLIVENCVFNSDATNATDKAAIETGNDYDATYNLYITNATVSDNFSVTTPKQYQGGDSLGTKVWGNKDRMPREKLNVYVDGVDVY